MWHQLYRHRILAACAALLLGLLPALSHGAGSSSLSRWLSREVVPELQTLLAGHPRYARQRVQLRAAGANDLDEAVVAVLRGNLGKLQAVSLLPPPARDPQPLAAAASIDELDCQSGVRADYQIRVSVSSAGSSRGVVEISLLDVASGPTQLRAWHWAGTFSAPEKRLAQKTSRADGSLAAPWSAEDVDVAARVLSRDFACALRPQVATRIDLQWPSPMAMPALFADTFNSSRHLLGSYAELATTESPGSYRVNARVEPFQDNVWQLWLLGEPRLADLPPVQAVTYFRVTGLQRPAPPARPAVGAVSVASVPVPGEALDFLDVRLLDATQSDRGYSRADLLVTLRIANTSALPIAYSFTLSGGHFDHCIAHPGNYRHDRYGSISGRLAPGVSVVRRLAIEKARHRPSPLLGTRKCAGFRDLDGFEKFTSEGYKVTDYVRWDL